MVKIYYGNGNGYNSYGEAFSAVIIHNIIVVITLVILGSAIYHYFIKKTVTSTLKYVTICLVLTLTFNVLFVSLIAFNVVYNVFNKKFLDCPTSVQTVPLLGMSRLFLYLYFLARYVYYNYISF